MNNYIYIFQAKMLESSHGWLGPSAASTLTGLSNHFTLLFHFLLLFCLAQQCAYGYLLHRKCFCFKTCFACKTHTHTCVVAERRDLHPIHQSSIPTKTIPLRKKNPLVFFPLSFSPYFLFCLLVYLHFLFIPIYL